MSELISKELLSLILDAEVTRVSDSINYINSVDYREGRMLPFTLNKDTLGRLCKEWCFKNGYFLESGTQGIGREDKLNGYSKVKKCGDINHNEMWLTHIEDTELDSIIKATEWVAKEKNLL